MSTSRRKKAPGRYNRADVKAQQARCHEMTVPQIAMALALMHGRTAVTAEDYRLAEMVATVQQRACEEITADVMEIGDDLIADGVIPGPR